MSAGLSVSSGLISPIIAPAGLRPVTTTSETSVSSSSEAAFGPEAERDVEADGAAAARDEAGNSAAAAASHVKTTPTEAVFIPYSRRRSGAVSPEGATT